MTSIPWITASPEVGMGMVGDLEDGMDEEVFLNFVKDRFGLSVIRHSELLGKTGKKSCTLWRCRKFSDWEGHCLRSRCFCYRRS